MSKFKVGDKVYYPTVGTKVYTLTESWTSAAPLLLPAGDDIGTIRVNTDGTVYYREAAPSIFHATKENYELLSKLYPEIELEKPPIPSTPMEVITKMLDDGWMSVACLVSDYHRSLIVKRGLTTDFISEVIPTACAPFRAASGTPWQWAQPIDIKTGRIIVDYVDGEIVLGD